MWVLQGEGKGDDFNERKFNGKKKRRKKKKNIEARAHVAMVTVRAWRAEAAVAGRAELGRGRREPPPEVEVCDLRVTG